MEDTKTEETERGTNTTEQHKKKKRDREREAREKRERTALAESKTASAIFCLCGTCHVAPSQALPLPKLSAAALRKTVGETGEAKKTKLKEDSTLARSVWSAETTVEA